MLKCVTDRVGGGVVGGAVRRGGCAVLAAAAGLLGVVGGVAAVHGQAITQINAKETNAIDLPGRAFTTPSVLAWPHPSASGGYLLWDDLKTPMSGGSDPGLKLDCTLTGVPSGVSMVRLDYTWTNWTGSVSTVYHSDAVSKTTPVFAITHLPTTCGKYKLTVQLYDDGAGTALGSAVEISEVVFTYKAPAGSTEADYPGFTLGTSTDTLNADMLRELASWIQGKSSPTSIGLAVMDKMRVKSMETGSGFVAGHAWLYSSANGESGSPPVATPDNMARRLLLGNGSDTNFVPTTRRRSLCDAWAGTWACLTRLTGVRNVIRHHYYVDSGKYMLLAATYPTPAGLRSVQMFDGRMGNVWLSDGNSSQSTGLPSDASTSSYNNQTPGATPAADFTAFADHAIGGINLTDSSGTPTSHVYFDPSFGIYWTGSAVTTSLPTSWTQERTASRFAHVQTLEDRLLCYTLTLDTPHCPSSNPVGTIRQFFGGLWLMRNYQASPTSTTANHSPFGYWIASRPDQPNNPFDAFVDSGDLQTATGTLLSPASCGSLYTRLPVRVRLRAQSGLSFGVRAWAMMGKGTGRDDYQWSCDNAPFKEGFETTPMSATVNDSGDTDLVFQFPGEFLAGVTSTTPIKVYYSVVKSLGADYNAMTQGSTGSSEFQVSGNPLVRGEVSFTLQSLGYTPSQFAATCLADIGHHEVVGSYTYDVPGPDCQVDNTDWSVFVNLLFAQDVRADIAGSDGLPGHDGKVDENDINLFTDYMMLSCP